MAKLEDRSSKSWERDLGRRLDGTVTKRFIATQHVGFTVTVA